jgi:Tfp pilus assembly protein PilO
MKKYIIQNSILNNILKKFKPVLGSEKTGSYFAITFSLFTLSFFGLFAIRPTLMTAVSLINSVSELRKLNVKYETKINSIIKAQAEYEKVRDDLSLVNVALPNNAFFSKLAIGLENIAQKSEITITQMSLDNSYISDLPPATKPSSLGFNLTVTGDYPSLTAYIRHLINWKRIITLNTLDITKDNSSTSSGDLKLTIKGQAYYEP